MIEAQGRNRDCIELSPFAELHAMTSPYTGCQSEIVLSDKMGSIHITNCLNHDTQTKVISSLK